VRQIDKSPGGGEVQMNFKTVKTYKQVDEKKLKKAEIIKVAKLTAVSERKFNI
jgi:hypothetical protein